MFQEEAENTGDFAGAGFWILGDIELEEKWNKG